jgi:hypothetical protein
MKISLEIDIHPFSVPLHVRPIERPQPRETGIIPNVTYPLSDLSVETLDRLCRDFRDQVFKSAGKEQPTEAR